MKNLFGVTHRILLAALLMALPAAMMGQEKGKKPQKELLHTLLYLKGDSTVEGYLMNYLNHAGLYTTSQLNIEDSLIRLKPLDAKLFAKNERYSFHDIDSMVTWSEVMPELRMTWIPMPINMAYGHQEAMVPDHLVMMLIFYHGRHVDGYLGFDDVLGTRAYYRTKSMDHAKALYKASGKLTDKRKGTLLDEFSHLPEMVSYIDSLGKLDFSKSPLDIITKLDSVLDSQP